MLARRVLDYIPSRDVGVAGAEIEDHSSSNLPFPAPARNRGDALLLHGLCHRLHAVERAHHVDLPEAVHFRRVGLLDREVFLHADAGAVDAVVNAPEGMHGGLDHLVHAGPVADIDGNGQRLVGCVCGDQLALVRCLQCGVVVSIGQDHAAGALGGVGQSTFSADATAGTGDDRDTIDQKRHVWKCEQAWLVPNLVEREWP